MKFLATRIVIAIALVSASASAIEVKGLRLGEPMTQQQLANLFGSASCKSGVVAETMLKMGYRRCTVPLSFLGVQTSADVNIFKGRAVHLTVSVPSALIDQIEMLFNEKYGPPIADETQGPCTIWRDVESSHIHVCRASANSGSNVTYEYAAPKTIDAADL